jgi:hypothetical protein
MSMPAVPVRAGRAKSTLTLAIVFLSVLLAACSSGAGQPSTAGGGGAGSPGAGASGGSTSTPSPNPDAIDHPTGATDIVLRVGEQGGFMMMEAVMSRVPMFTLYGDGRVVIAQFPEAAPGQAGLNGVPQQVLRETHFSEDQVQGLLQYALVEGKVGIAKESFPVFVMDVPDTVIELHAGGVDKTIKVAGLGMDPQPGPDAAVLTSLAELVAKIQSITADQDYAATASLAILNATEPAPGVTAQPWPWPDTAPSDFTQPKPNDPFGFTSHVLSAAESDAIGIAPGEWSAPLTLAGPDGKTYAVIVRPALPEEAAAG